MPQPNRSVKLSSKRDELYDGLLTPFVSPAEAATFGEFYVTQFERRRNRKFNREECAFYVTFVETPDDGTPNDRLLTLEANAYRIRVGAIMAGMPAGSTLGPLVLMQQATKDDAAFYWVFGEVNEQGTAEAIADPNADPRAGYPTAG